ncbi:MAG TPA: LemA family protein [Candidatus Pacebacteria bacterium]|nr:LemA family protein [Candidatus Paceibacterota bacterium]
MFGIIILIGIVVLVVAVVGIYNTLVKMRMRVDEAWSDIDVQLKRRYDLIPNLVETVKGYAKHESETLQAVMEARSKATAINIDAGSATAEDMAAFAGAQEGLSGALGKLFAVSENYPDLKANQNFLELQNDLTDTEDKIQASRRFYNGTVRDYNIKVETVPSNIIAGMFGFVKREFFEIEDEKERKTVKVEF